MPHHTSVVHVAACLAACGAIALFNVACTGGEKGTGLTPGGTGGGGASAESGGGRTGGDGGDGPSASGTGAGSGDGGAGATAGVTVSASASVTSVSATSGASTGGGTQVAEVFAHSATTLYRIDLETNAVETVGEFSGCGGDVIDIALDKNSQMFGTTNGGLYQIDRTTAACASIASGEYPNSLSFVPAGTLDPQNEQLVGYFDADYVRIDTVSGAVQTIASNALPSGLISSGDIVSVIDGPTLLTVKGGACDPSDCVVEVDPATGSVLVNHGSIVYQNVFGIAFWDGNLYGFTSYGEAFELVPDGSGGYDANTIPVSAESFYGAGSTTAAPPGTIN